MDKIIGFFVKQKKLALVFTSSIIFIGFIVSFAVQRDRFPDVELDIMIVSANHYGASPKDIELTITNPIEKELKNVQGIDYYTSVSREGSMRITVNLDPDVKNINKARQDVKDAVNRVRDLPSDLKNLPIAKDAEITRNIIQINLVDNKTDYDTMRFIVNNLEKQLSQIPGVSSINKSGYLEPEVKIYLSKEKLNKYKISLYDVLSKIKARNIRYTAGHNESLNDERNFVVLAKFLKPESVGEVVLLSSYDGPKVKLKDVANIYLDSEEETYITRVNGKKGFVLRVKKQDSADIITLVENIKTKITELKKDLPSSLDIFYTDDASFHVKNRLDIVTNNGIIGLILILIVLGSFLSIRSAFWVAVSLPVVIFGLVILLQISGETINLISLAAVILVLGLVVDDSIIIAESINYYQQRIPDKHEASIKGFIRVISPVVITMLTTVLVFSSMFLMTGIMGKFIYVMPVVVIFALIISFFEIFIALPAHLTSNKVVKERAWFLYFENWFEKISHTLLRFRYLVIVFFILIFVFSLWVASSMKFSLFPEVGADKINTRLEVAVGSSLQYTEQKVIELEQVIFNIVGENLDSVSSEIGKRFNHIARLEISLIPAASRKLSGRDIQNKLEQAIKKIDGAKIRFYTKKPGPRVGKDIEIYLVSEDDEQRKQASNKLVNILTSIDGFNGLDRDDELGKKRIVINLDFDAIAEYDLNINTINNYIRASLNGIEADVIRLGSDDVPLQVYLSDNNKLKADISKLKIPNKSKLLIPITQFAKLEYITGESDYNHYNGDRSITITGSVDDTKNSAGSIIEEALAQLNLATNYPKVRYILGGGSDETIKSIQSFIKAFLLSVIGIFLLLMLLFNSYTQPLMVIFSIPLAIVGVIFAFYLHNQPISFFTMLGSLALVGVVVNDALILISHLNFLQKQQNRVENLTTRIKWIAKGARDRLRAVILTTLTTLAGVLPLSYGIGGTDFLLQPMALALGYGLLFGTVMTLIFMPALYLINLEIVEWFQNIFNRKTVND